jgi:transcriptional regulator with XRE-family HTH domain
MATKKNRETGKDVKLLFNSLKDRIVLARSSSSISQMKLAENLDIHVTTLSKYERGKRVPDARTLNRIAEVTGCPSGWLLSGDGAIEGKTVEDEGEEVTAKYISLLEQNVKRLEQENAELKGQITKPSTKPKATKKK